ncbi:MAG TPA: hypothetical protein VGN20_22955 [Mucilaginibacter sp.]|jgi:hypothetical protein
MKLSAFAIIITILAFGFGLAFVFIPAKFVAFYGASLDGGGVVVGRYFGGSNIFLGMIFWSYSKVPLTAKSWPKLLRYNLIYDILMLIISLMAVLNAEVNTMGWTTVALFVLLAIGSGYFLMQSNKTTA